MSGVTDLLLNTLRHAEAGDESGIQTNLERLSERHLETCKELLKAERCDRTAQAFATLSPIFAGSPMAY